MSEPGIRRGRWYATNGGGLGLQVFVGSTFPEDDGWRVTGTVQKEKRGRMYEVCVNRMDEDYEPITMSREQADALIEELKRSLNEDLAFRSAA